MKKSILDDPIVNIIVPVYNTEEFYLNRCLKSLIQQTYRNIRVLVTDDGSQKPTADLLDEWAEKDSRIEVFHQQNAGVAGARNSALEKISIRGGGMCYSLTAMIGGMRIMLSSC